MRASSHASEAFQRLPIRWRSATLAVRGRRAGGLWSDRDKDEDEQFGKEAQAPGAWGSLSFADRRGWFARCRQVASGYACQSTFVAGLSRQDARNTEFPLRSSSHLYPSGARCSDTQASGTDSKTISGRQRSMVPIAPSSARASNPSTSS